MIYSKRQRNFWFVTVFIKITFFLINNRFRRGLELKLEENICSDLFWHNDCHIYTSI
jgi:hypothetical protein